MALSGQWCSFRLKKKQAAGQYQSKISTSERGQKPHLLPEGSPNGVAALGCSVAVAHHGIQSQTLEGSLSSKGS